MGAKKRLLDMSVLFECEGAGAEFCCRVKQKIGKASTVYGCAVRILPTSPYSPCPFRSPSLPYTRSQILIANQMATKLLTATNKPATFDTGGDRAILMPQLGNVPPSFPHLIPC